MTAELWEVLQKHSPDEVLHLERFLGSTPEGELPGLLKLVKALNCQNLGRFNEADRIFLSICEDDIACMYYGEDINDHRIRYANLFASDRLKVLTNFSSGRIGFSLLANADIIVFAQGPELATPKPSLITYRPVEDRFSDILDQLPDGWQPDYVLLFLPETISLPKGLEESPYPVVGLPGDPWKINKLSQDIRFFDALMPAMKHLCPAFDRLGETKVLYSSCSGTQGGVRWIWKNFAKPSEAKKYDVIFTGSTSSPLFRKRDHYLWRLLKLGERHKIFIGHTESTVESLELLALSKIVVHCPSRQGGVNLRPFEAAVCGALLFHEEGDRTIEEFFEPGKEVVLFNEENFEALIEHYLSQDEEREEMVGRAMEKALSQHSIRLNMKNVIQEIGRANIGMDKRTASKMSEDAKLNALGISDFYAVDYSRSIDCFRKAINIDGQNGKYHNNLAVALMVDGFINQRHNPETMPSLLEANREDRATAASLFNFMSYYRYIEPDRQELLKWAGALMRILSWQSEERPRYYADELVFFLESRNDKTYGESLIFRMEMEFALLSFPDRGPEYQELFHKTLLWRTLEYMGDIYLERDEAGGAAAIFRSALKHCPANELILGKLGKTYLGMGMLEEAAFYLRELLRLSPLHENAHLDLSRAEMALGQRVEIRDRLTRLLRFSGLENREQFESLLAQTN